MSMAFIVAFAAALLAFGGSWLLYLVSPQQQWWPTPLATRPGLSVAAVALLASLVLLLAVMGTGAAFFSWLTAIMLVTTLAPFLGAWRRNHHAAGPRA